MVLSPMYRWYETGDRVVIDIPLKKVTEKNVNVTYEAEHLEFTAQLPDNPHEKEYSFKLNLHDAIVPDQCSCKVRPSKIEVFLPKLMHTRWGSLEKGDEPVSKVPTPPKNWDKVVKESLTDRDEEGGVDQLFAKIYEDGNDDQKRAMLKSFTESGGTVLSTNWDEVGRQKVEMKPPDGVEFKPWN